MKTKGIKHTIVGRKLKSEIARLESMSDKEFEEEKKGIEKYKQEVYKEADIVIIKYYYKLLEIHLEEAVLLKKKEKLNKMRMSLIQIIGHEVFDERVKAILPDRTFEV